jgi:hypothetical protein
LREFKKNFRVGNARFESFLSLNSAFQTAAPLYGFLRFFRIVPEIRRGNLRF